MPLIIQYVESLNNSTKLFISTPKNIINFAIFVLNPANVVQEIDHKDAWNYIVLE